MFSDVPVMFSDLPEMFLDVLEMFSDVLSRFQMFSGCPQLIKIFYRDSQMCSRCAQMFSDVHRCFQMITDVYGFSLDFLQLSS